MNTQEQKELKVLLIEDEVQIRRLLGPEARGRLTRGLFVAPHSREWVEIHIFLK